MPEISVDHLGQVGIVRDLANYRLIPNAWTDGRNVTFDDDKVRRMYGSTPLWPGLNMVPLHVMFQRAVDDLFWIVAGQSRIKVWNGGVWTDISRGTLYNANLGLGWNGGIFGGLAVLNNGVDAPQYWARPDVLVRFADLPGWPADTTARVLRPFGSFLVAGNITKSGDAFEHMVKWSHRADPGSPPMSWDHTDATLDAGETNLIDTSAGPILDMASIGDSLFIYKAGSIWEVTRTRDFNIFDFKNRFQTTGILSTNCVTQIPRRKENFLMTGDDLVLHNGQAMESLIDRRWRRWLVQEMAFEAGNTAFVVPNPFHNECWFCFPEVGNDWCTKALVWNYVENTIGVRDLEQVSCGASGIVIEELETWDVTVESWDDRTQAWNTLNYDPRKTTILLGDPINQRVMHGAKRNQIDGVDLQARIERKALAIVGRDLQGQPIADSSVRKMAQRLWIQAAGAPFKVQLGAHNEEDGEVDWDSEVAFNPAVDQYVDPIVPPNGRYLAVRFLSDSGDPWQLEGYKLEFETLGAF